MKSEFSKYLLGLSFAFGVPWLVLVVWPFASSARQQPVPYSEADAMETATVFPPERSGNVEWGERVYLENGCTYCHTQVVRPTYAGTDLWRPGWGGREEQGWARETRPEDFMRDRVAPLGYQRIGPDLANVGTRRTDRQWHHLHLYAPRSVKGDSVMPAYKYLYEVRPIQLQRSDRALPLEGNDAPEEGFEVVPTPKAEALVDYLISRRMDAPVPGSGGAEEGEADAAQENES